ncbi:hypothetical protein ABLV11_00280 [Klebsiella sp. GW_Kp181]|uniref:hypothetical protein n=1 Tax=Klebsiella sp. GW_Kp181 TaxID=3153492 RepID=UPI0032B5B11F
MTTDITKLAQREKFEAWAEERCALPWGYLKNRRTNTGYFSKHDYTSLWAAWKAAGAELVEALEKAQQRIDELENDEVRQRLANAEHQLYMAELAKNNLRASRKAQFRKRKAAEQRIAELESRTVTVKLPKLKMLEDYLAEVAIEERKAILLGVRMEFHRALNAAGIKWEAD